jgi:hypothetical protein
VIEDPNKQMLKETGAGLGASTLPKTLKKDKEYEQIF